ncbi:hypothetical protein ACFLRY_02350 [Bacteroidota bacterium]
MNKSLIIIPLFLIQSIAYSQDIFKSSVWNFKIHQLSKPFIIQDENNNFTASFDLEDEGLMLLEIYPKDRICKTDEECLNKALKNVMQDIVNQDPEEYSGMKERTITENDKSGYSGLRVLYSNNDLNAIVDLYITDGYLYVLSITTLLDPEKYYPYLNTFEFLEEAKEHGERRK